MIPKNNIKILYVDDEKSNLNAFKAGFRSEFEVFIAESVKEGLGVLEVENIHIIITDQRMPNITGIEFLESIMVTHPHCVRILLTGYSNMETVIDAINKGKIFQYVTKPYVETELKELIFKAYDEHERVQKIIRDNEKLEFILRQKLL